MELTASDWSDLRLAAIAVIAFAAIEALLTWLYRRGKGVPPSPIRIWSPWLLLFTLWLFGLGPILERRGLPAWGSAIVLALLFFAGLSPLLRKMHRELLAEGLLDRPGNHPEPSAQPALVSQEEKMLASQWQVIGIGGIVFAGLALGLIKWAFVPSANASAGAGAPFVGLAALGLAILVILYPLLGRWPGRVSHHVSIDLAATPEQVWDALTLRDDYPGWKPIYARIDRLDEPGEVYRLHSLEDSQCLRCGLPRHPDRSRWSMRIETVEARRPALYRQVAVPEGNVKATLDYEESLHLLEPLADGGTRVTYTSIVTRPKMWLALQLRRGAPGKEHLLSLKAYLEGTPDESLYGFSAKRIAAARAAPQHCACPS